MKNLNCCHAAESSESIWSLRKLMTLVEDTKNIRKLPTVKEILERTDVLATFSSSGSTLTVYKCGFFLYTSGRRSTVQDIQRCLNPVWYDTATNKIAVPAEQFLDMPFYVRLVLEGEDRITANQQSQENKKTTSTDNLDIESSFLKDKDSDFVTRWLDAEDVSNNRRKLTQALKTLTPHQYDAVIKYFVSEMTYQEIADEMGCAKQTVYENVKKALEKMRNYLTAN